MNLQIARTRAVNSDGAGNALQAWAMLHGNLLLHGWHLSDVPFYTTELPEYMLVELVRGLNADVVHVAAAVTYTLAMLLAALLAKGTATGREGVARVLITAGIMLAPQLDSGVNVLISSPDHIGTSVPVLAVWLLLDHARPRWYIPVIVAGVLGWAEVADTLVLYIGVLPLALVCAVRVYRAAAVQRRPLASQWYYVALGVGALAGAAAAMLALHVIYADGGFYSPHATAQLAAACAILPGHLRIAAEGLLILGGETSSGSSCTPRPHSSSCTWSAWPCSPAESGRPRGTSWPAATWSHSCGRGRGHQPDHVRDQHPVGQLHVDPRDRGGPPALRRPGRALLAGRLTAGRWCRCWPLWRLATWPGWSTRSASRRCPRRTSAWKPGWRPGTCTPVCPATGSPAS